MACPIRRVPVTTTIELTNFGFNYLVRPRAPPGAVHMLADLVVGRTNTEFLNMNQGKFFVFNLDPAPLLMEEDCVYNVELTARGMDRALDHLANHETEALTIFVHSDDTTKLSFFTMYWMLHKGYPYHDAIALMVNALMSQARVTVYDPRTRTANIELEQMVFNFAYDQELHELLRTRFDDIGEVSSMPGVINTIDCHAHMSSTTTTTSSYHGPYTPPHSGIVLDAPPAPKRRRLANRQQSLLPSYV